MQRVHIIYAMIALSRPELTALSGTISHTRSLQALWFQRYNYYISYI